MLPPISSPRVFEIIEYAPPPPMLIFVVIELSARPVVIVTETANKIIPIVPRIPASPTIYPSLRKSITPIMLRKVGMKTPLNVPKLLDPVCFSIFI